jgi:hypothetical protein
MSKTLTKYQLKARDSFIFGLCGPPQVSGLLLFHYMGTGKTFNAIAIIVNYLSFVDEIAIVCPDYLKGVWEKELDVEAKHVIPKGKLVVLGMSEAPPSADRDKKRFVVIDEVQNIFSKYSANKHWLMFARQARLRLMLTGTPPSNTEDFCAIMATCNLGLPQFSSDIVKEFVSDSAVMWAVNSLVHYVLPVYTVFSPLLYYLRSFDITTVAAGTALSLAGSCIQYAQLEKYLVKWNIKKMKTLFAPFVSIVGDPSLNDPFFPTFSEHSLHCYLNTQELNIGDQWMTGRLSEALARRLDIAADHTVNLANLRDLVTQEVVLDKGRGLGLFEGLRSSKCEALKLLFQKDKRQTIIYTELKLGLHVLKKLMHEQNYKYAVIEKGTPPSEAHQSSQRFNLGQVRFLIFFRVSEGISTKNCDLVVFVEPPLTQADYQQLIGRARRLDSHAHLGKKVNIPVITLVSIIPDTGSIQQILGSHIGKLKGILNMGERNAAIVIAAGFEIRSKYLLAERTADNVKTQAEFLEKLSKLEILFKGKTPEYITSIMERFVGPEVGSIIGNNWKWVAPILRTSAETIFSTPLEIYEKSGIKGVFGMWSSVVYAGSLAQIFLRPRKTVRDLTKWAKHAFHSRMMTRVDYVLKNDRRADNTIFESATPCQLVLKQTQDEAQQSTALFTALTKDNVQTNKVPSVTECKPCSVWPESPVSSESSCSRRVDPGKS